MLIMTNNLPKLTSCFIQYGLKLVIEPINKDFTEVTEQGRWDVLWQTQESHARALPHQLHISDPEAERRFLQSLLVVSAVAESLLQEWRQNELEKCSYQCSENCLFVVRYNNCFSKRNISVTVSRHLLEQFSIQKYK